MQPNVPVVALVEPRAARPMRVCLVIGQLGLGGTEKQVVLLAEGLHRRGHEVTVLVLTGPGPRDEALHAAGVPIVHLNLRHPGDWRAVPLLAATAGRLTAFLRRYRPDVVHAFLFHSYVMTAPAARIAGVPVLIAGRRSLDDFKRGHRVTLFLERLATRMTHALVANADAVAECAHRTERVPRGKISVIYNGLPPTAFADPGGPPRANRQPVVLCVANLKPDKGHRFLLDAVARLRALGRPCTVLLAGEGPHRTDIERQVETLGLDVELLGARTDVDELLGQADVVVLPSLTEGMSNAVMEAMAAGRPVIATTVGGLPELLADGRGLLIPPGDPQRLAEALASVFTDRERAARMGWAARAWSREHLSADAMVERHVTLYRGLLAGRCAG